MAEARTLTFGHRRKLFLVSTPTLSGLSRIEREYLASDQRRYFVPCPMCGHRQHLRFERLRWEEGRPDTAAYWCEGCEWPIEERHKRAMLAAGVWQPTATTSDSLTVGFHLSALYAPPGWLSWPRIAAMKLQAARAPETHKAFVNAVLGETWVESGDAPDWQRLYERRGAYPIGTVPAGGLLLTAGADVQRDRVEVSVWAWGRGRERWLVEHRVLMGAPGEPEVWRALTALTGETWRHDSGRRLPLRGLAIDSGFATQEVYAWARTQHPALVFAVKGVERASTLVGLSTAVDATLAGKRLRRGAKVRAVASRLAKLELYNALNLAAPVDGEPYPPGYVHLPRVDEEYCKQLCAEQLVTVRNRRGYARREWRKLRECNEALDCATYARAAAAIVGLDRLTEGHGQGLERPLRPSPAPAAVALDPPRPVAPRRSLSLRSRRIIPPYWE